MAEPFLKSLSCSCTSAVSSCLNKTIIFHFPSFPFIQFSSPFLSSCPYLDTHCSFLPPTPSFPSIPGLIPESLQLPPSVFSQLLFSCVPVSLSSSACHSLSPRPFAVSRIPRRNEMAVLGRVRASLSISLFEKQYSRVRKGRLGTSNHSSLSTHWAVWVFLDDYFPFCRSHRLSINCRHTHIK